jgi:hypothetical protein
VPTLLTSAGVLLSIAALAVLIGIGETQLLASEANNGSDLYGNGWFLVGLGFMAFGAGSGLIAALASGSQGKALKEAPKLKIDIVEKHLCPEVTEPSGEHTQLLRVTLRITNLERTRSVGLSIGLVWPSELGHPPPGKTAWERLLPVHARSTLQANIKIDPLDAEEGDAFFEIYRTELPYGLLERLPLPDTKAPPYIDAVDHLSGKGVEEILKTDNLPATKLVA